MCLIKLGSGVTQDCCIKKGGKGGGGAGSEPRVQSNEGVDHIVSAQDVLTH